nr:MAG: hypothetical protein [Bacteriophage sp.]
MIKQRAVKVYYNGNGCWGYEDLVRVLSNGWIVKRMDPLYNYEGKAVSNVYILEKEVDKKND